MEFFELRRIDRARRAEHQVLVTLGLRKSDHISDVFSPNDRHHQSVNSGRDPTVRWYPVLECIQQVSKLGPDALTAHPENLEHLFLQLSFVNANAAARDLDSVQNAVICLGPDVIGP